jgi:tetratricopeptide (TPR) repeat protein
MGNSVEMNRDKKRQRTLAKKKAAKKARRTQLQTSSGDQKTLTVEQSKSLQLAIEHHTAGRLTEAEGIYQAILKVDPRQPVALHLLGVIARQVGKGEVAFELISKALAVNPNYAEAHNNLGNTLKGLGRFDEALASYQKALAIKPNYADAHNNLGNAFKDQGRLDEASASYRRALAIKPDYAEAHNNLGSALQGLGELDEAEACYRKALQLNPLFDVPNYNLYSLLLDPVEMTPSIRCIEKVVDARPKRLDYRFILGILLDYSGKPQEAIVHFEMVERGSSLDRARIDAWRYIKSAHSKMPPMIGSSIQALRMGIDAAVNDGLVLEFGVRFGTSIRQLAALTTQEVHGFDSFEGIPETWNREPKGAYSTKGIIPSVPQNVTLHRGWFEETLPGFLEKHDSAVRFINIDCDIYSSTKTILELLATRIKPGTVIVFDEYLGNETWREDEFRAFQETVRKHGWNYEYLCFSFMTKQVVVRIN